MRIWLISMLLIPAAAIAEEACEGVRVYVDPFLVAQVEISGKPARLALDPIRNVLLDEAFAKEAGFELLDAQRVGYEGRVTIGGAGAREQVPAFAVGQVLAISGERHELPPLVVVDLRGPLGGGFEDIDGLLGTDLFTDHVLDIDPVEGCLHLHDREDFVPPGGPIAIERMRHRPVVTGEMELPSGESFELRFLLDFGMAGSVRLSTRFVDEHELHERLPTTVPERMETGLGGQLESLETTAARVRIGDATWHDLSVRLARETQGADADPPWDALVGVGLLQTRRMVYDPAGDRFWLLPSDRE